MRGLVRDRQVFCGGSPKLCSTLVYTEEEGSFSLPHTEWCGPGPSWVEGPLSCRSQASPLISHTASSLLLPSVSALATLFVCLACSACQTSFCTTLPHTTFIKPFPALFQSSPRWWEISLGKGKTPALITTCHCLFVRQLLLVLSCTVKHSYFLLMCPVLCVVYHELHSWCHTYIYDANHWFAKWFWLDWLLKNMCRCWAIGQCIQKWQLSWCASLLGAYGAWFPEVLKTVDRSSLCFTLLNHASFAIAHFSTYLALISLCCLDHAKGH